MYNWKWTGIKDGQVYSEVFETDMNLPASSICAILESKGFEITYLRKIIPLMQILTNIFTLNTSTQAHV